MGSSGAGKTSLMNAMSARINRGKGCNLEGEILLND
jgi:ABC-type multidrug transport system ATPase subunit